MERSKMSKNIAEKLLSADGVDRRGFLECMAWAGTGMIWAMKGGVAFSQETHHAGMMHDSFSFVQISDSHIGFNKPANENVIGTLQEAVGRINALPSPPAFLIHTGDIAISPSPRSSTPSTRFSKPPKLARS